MSQLIAAAVLRRNADSKPKRAEAAELYEGMVAAMERARVGDHQVAALLLKLSEVSAPRTRRQCMPVALLIWRTFGSSGLESSCAQSSTTSWVQQEQLLPGDLRRRIYCLAQAESAPIATPGHITSCETPSLRLSLSGATYAGIRRVGP